MARKKRFKEELPVEERPIWSPSRLDLAETCMKAYWLKYVKKRRPLISPSTARGKLIHSMIENFWKIDKSTGLIIPEPKFSYGGFVNMGIAQWRFNYASEKRKEKRPTDEIKWDFKGQQWSKSFEGELADMLGRIYNRYINEEPRVDAEVELYAEIEGIKIMAIIDELRRDLVIRDHKSGYAKPNQEYLNKNIQMTDYLLCLFIALQDSNSKIYQETYADYAGIGLKEFLDTASIEIHHLPDMNRPYFSRKTGEFVYPERDVMTSIHTAKRTEQSIADFVESLQSKEKALRERDFHAHQGRHCGFCFFREECDKYDPKKEHASELERNLPLFSYSNLSFGNMASQNPLANSSSAPKPLYRQKTMRFKYLSPEQDKKAQASSEELKRIKENDSQLLKI